MPNLTFKRVIGSAVLLLAIVLIGKTLFFSEKFVPEEFSQARISGAKITEEIVAQSNYSAQLIEKISKLDREGNYPEALGVVSNEIAKNWEANKKAATLSSRLERMARSIEQMKPYRARQLATEAVSSEVALVSRLINYNAYVSQLFEVLRDKFQSGNSSSNGQVQELIKQINNEVYSINELNQRFNESLQEFDELFL